MVTGVEPDDSIRRELERLRQRVAYYEEPTPMGKGNCYHKFNDDGICIRCHEDAEEWDAGCVEETVEELADICTLEFVEALERVIPHAYRAESAIEHVYAGIAARYLEKVKKIAEDFALARSWAGETNGVVADSGSSETGDPGEAGADFLI